MPSNVEFTMPYDPRYLEDHVFRVQTAFLESPDLELTLGQAQSRFGLDEVVCAAVLEALVALDVLTRTGAGVYRQAVPHVDHIPDSWSGLRLHDGIVQRWTPEAA